MNSLVALWQTTLLGGAMMLPALAPPCWAQTALAAVAAASENSVAPGGPSPSSGAIFREICDLHSGARWLLLRDPANPAGPGRLVLAGDAPDILEKTRVAARPDRAAPAIHAGERLMVEERSAVAEGRLEAVALEPAQIGSTLDVRLRIGGKVMRAVALAPGRAALAAPAEVRR